MIGDRRWGVLVILYDDKHINIHRQSTLPGLFPQRGKLTNDPEYFLKSFIRTGGTVVSLERYENKLWRGGCGVGMISISGCMFDATTAAFGCVLFDSTV